MDDRSGSDASIGNGRRQCGPIPAPPSALGSSSASRCRVCSSFRRGTVAFVDDLLGQAGLMRRCPGQSTLPTTQRFLQRNSALQFDVVPLNDLCDPVQPVHHLHPVQLGTQEPH